MDGGGGMLVGGAVWVPEVVYVPDVVVDPGGGGGIGAVVEDGFSS